MSKSQSINKEILTFKETLTYKNKYLNHYKNLNIYIEVKYYSFKKKKLCVLVCIISEISNIFAFA